MEAGITPWFVLAPCGLCAELDGSLLATASSHPILHSATASLVVNCSSSASASEHARSANLQCLLRFNLTVGRPLLKGFCTLTNDDGMFMSRNGTSRRFVEPRDIAGIVAVRPAELFLAIKDGRIDRDEVYHEVVPSTARTFRCSRIPAFGRRCSTASCISRPVPSAAFSSFSKRAASRPCSATPAKRSRHMIGSRSLARKPHTPSSFPSVPFQSCRSCCYRLRSVLRRNVLCRVAANMLSRSVLQRTCCPADPAASRRCNRRIVPPTRSAPNRGLVERARSRCRCGRGEPSPGAGVGGVSPVPAQMWQRWPGADVGGVSPVPEQIWAG